MAGRDSACRQRYHRQMANSRSSSQLHAGRRPTDEAQDSIADGSERSYFGQRQNLLATISGQEGRAWWVPEARRSPVRHVAHARAGQELLAIARSKYLAEDGERAAPADGRYRHVHWDAIGNATNDSPHEVPKSGCPPSPLRLYGAEATASHTTPDYRNCRSPRRSWLRLRSAAIGDGVGVNDEPRPPRHDVERHHDRMRESAAAQHRAVQPHHQHHRACAIATLNALHLALMNAISARYSSWKSAFGGPRSAIRSASSWSRPSASRPHHPSVRPGLGFVQRCSPI